jgi:hypothetical protein
MVPQPAPYSTPAVKLTHCFKAQTPQQRKANEKFAKQEAAKRGKPESAIKKKEKFKSPIGPVWIGMTYTENRFCD